MASNSPVYPFYAPGRREALWELRVWAKNPTQLGPRPRLELRPLDPESSHEAITLPPSRGYENLLKLPIVHVYMSFRGALQFNSGLKRLKMPIDELTPLHLYPSAPTCRTNALNVCARSSAE